MRKKFVLPTLLLIAGLLLSFDTSAQISFGVSPGLSFNGAYVGYKVKAKIMPFIGFQALSANYRLRYERYQFNDNTNSVQPVTDESEVKATLLMPNLGARYYLIDKENLKGYLSLNIAKPIIRGKAVFDGEEDEEFSESLKSMNIWVGEFGFGAEYLFDEHFSIGGEFGVRYLRFKAADTYTQSVYNPTTGNYEDKEAKNAYVFAASPTYSRISLNFYF